MAGRHVAFFRNLNLGQRGSPTTQQVFDAFAEAGATGVGTVRVNGTVVFSSSSPARTRDLVCSLLARRSDWCDVAPVRTAGWVRRLAVELVLVEGNAEVSFFDSRHDFPEALPWRPAAGRLTVVRADRRHAISVNDEPRRSHATPVLERLLGVRVTSRGADTVLAVADRLA
jgi:uncharacterized protein (DUF1697 family)